MVKIAIPPAEELGLAKCHTVDNVVWITGIHVQDACSDAVFEAQRHRECHKEYLSASCWRSRHGEDPLVAG